MGYAVCMLQAGRATARDGPGGMHREEARVDEPETEPLRAEDGVVVGWIDAHWDELAALAWRGYVSRGRGLVLVREADGGEMVAEYETPDAAVADQDTWPDELLAAIGEYNPATDVLFLMEPEGAGMLLGMRATPPCVTPWEAGHGDEELPVVCSA